MHNNPRSPVLQYLRRIVAKDATVHETDGKLLARFLGQRDEAAFAALVYRHAPMVHGVCRRILRDADDAEDAFQATFLVLVRSAAGIGKREALGSWLYKVAYRTALRARAASARRRMREQEAAVDPIGEPSRDEIWWELRPLLDEELAQLPKKYRTSLIICYFQGKTKEEAARQLGCPAGTVSSRLARGRELLRVRLARRGVTISAVGLAAALPSGTSLASPALVNATIRAANAISLGKAAVGGAISSHVAALTEGMARAMIMVKVKTVTAVVLTLLAAASGIGLVAARALAQEPPARIDNVQPANAQLSKPSEPADEMVDVMITREVINPYTALTQEMFTVRRFSKKMAEGWLSANEIRNLIDDKRMLKIRVNKYKPLTSDDFYDSAKDSLRGVLQVGEIAKTIKVDRVSHPAGLILAGLHVDIEATRTIKTPDGDKPYTQIILQDIEVLATNGVVADNQIQEKQFDRATLRLTREQGLTISSFQQDATTSFRLLMRPVGVDRKKEANAAATSQPPNANRFDRLLQELVQSKRSDGQIIEALYLATQSRLPTEAERKKAIDRLDAAGNREKAFTELLQTLTNPK
jgi:Flp pilus assembly protein CpaB